MLVFASLLLASVTSVAPINVGNALTLPSARHLVRIDPQDGHAPAQLFAVQQDGAAGHGLSFYRSDDEGASFHHYAAIQPDWSERSVADMVVVGNDIALVYGYEGPTLAGSSRHDVYFQWWRYSGGQWNARPAVRVFDSPDNSHAYSRALVAVDSVGRIWVQAFRLAPDGVGSTAVISVSEDDGQTFTQQPDLDTLVDRGGGRLLHLGSKLIFVYASHGCCIAGRLRTRNDSDPINQWTAVTQPLPEGIYHGAAASAVADGQGGMHLVYKGHDEKLYYRYYNGSSFGPVTSVETQGDWAIQPAITLTGGKLYIFYNRPITTDKDYDFRLKILSNGVLSGSTVVAPSGNFKGYPAAAATMPDWLTVPCLFGQTPTSADSGNLMLVEAPAENPGGPHDGGTPDAGTPDAGTPDAGTPDAGTPDAGTPDAGTPDAGTPDAGTPPPAGVLFTDHFERTSATDLGPDWTILAGAFRTNSKANSNLDGVDRAAVRGIQCADCRIDARLVGFGVSETALFLRAQDGAQSDRYDLNLTSGSQFQLRRWRNGAVTVLASGPSGISDPSNWANVSFSAEGAGPVKLTAWSFGVQRLSFVDGTVNAVLTPGLSGISTLNAGVLFDDFVLTGLADGGASDGGTPDAGTPDAGTPDAGTPDAGTPDAGTPDAGTPDAGTPDAGTPDAGTPDAGTPDAGTPDAGTPDAGTPDAGTPDAGTPDAGTPDAGTPDAGTPDAGTPPPSGVLFTDHFERTSATDLGPAWTIQAGAFRTNSKANSNLDGVDRAAVTGIQCADCRIDVRAVGFGVAETAIFLRAQAGAQSDRYDLNLTNSNQLQIRRWVNGVATVLAQGPSGISDPSNWANISFVAEGPGPVTLTAFTGGVQRLKYLDGASQAVLAPGLSGISTRNAGVLFDDFVLTGVATAGGGGSPDGGTPDAGTPDAGTPDAGTPDGGAPDGGSDGGVGIPGGGTLAMDINFQSSRYQIMAVDPAGTTYATSNSAGAGQLYASTDNARTFSLRGSTSGSFWIMTALADGTLLANVQQGSNFVLSWSGDGGRTWTAAQSLGNYRALTPHSFGELDGTVYFIEYQVFTNAATPINLWASTDRGRSWSVRHVFQGHRHGHGLAVDHNAGALWALFGDTTPQSGTYRSTDGGRTWVTMVTGQEGDVVDATVLNNGTLLFGQDISYEPSEPHVATVTPSGDYNEGFKLSGPAYSTFAARSGALLVGAAHEVGTDVSPPGDVSAHLFGSADGVHWTELLRVAPNNTDDVRLDAYWELPSGEVLIQADNAAVFGGRGYYVVRLRQQ